MEIVVSDGINLEKIHASGQSFRWTRVCKPIKRENEFLRITDKEGFDSLFVQKKRSGRVFETRPAFQKMRTINRGRCCQRS